MARLLDRDAAEIIAAPIDVAKEAATRWGQVVVLKYGYTVATDGTTALIADDAPVSLATAGTGDVFAGTIGAFLAQGLAPLDAAGLALFVGPRAARLVERRTGRLGLVAGDLPFALAEVLAYLETQTENGDA
jgi:NAD(P)H-hydrate epimerase